MGVRGRVDRLERAARVGVRRDIVVVAEGGVLEDKRAGEVEYWPNGAGFKLIVAAELPGRPDPGPLPGPDRVAPPRGRRRVPSRFGPTRPVAGMTTFVYRQAVWTGRGWAESAPGDPS